MKYVGIVIDDWCYENEYYASLYSIKFHAELKARKSKLMENVFNEKYNEVEEKNG